MTDHPNRPPLWREINKAIIQAPRGRDYCAPGAAAMIRAVRDWLVPEEDVIPDGDLIEQAYRSDERAGLRAILTTEADRAETEGA